MERLQTLLKDYIKNNNTDFNKHEWTKSFEIKPYPVYWQSVYAIAKSLPKSLSVLEIGAGFGFVTSIFKYLEFENIESFEQDAYLCNVGNKMLSQLFQCDDCIKPLKFNLQEVPADILVLVNCSYADGCENKEEYKCRLLSYYNKANKPNYYILEVIDSSYQEYDENFPCHVRLSSEDIIQMFPDFKISSWPTYIYPQNKKSKTLYLIEKK